MKIKLKNTKNEYDYSMTAKETIGALVVLVLGLVVYLGIQFLSSPNAIGGTQIPLSFVGIIMIVGGIALIIWFVKAIIG